jgi:hypothetical protein
VFFEITRRANTAKKPRISRACSRYSASEQAEPSRSR